MLCGLLAFYCTNFASSTDVAVSSRMRVAKVAAKAPSADSDGRVCAMSQDKEFPSAEPLNWCKEYSENSCCSVAEDKKLMSEFDTYWRSAAGHCPGCISNVKAFQCAYTCGPSQADFVSVVRDSPDKHSKVKEATIRMCSQFCSAFHSSCSNITIAEMEKNNANSFCQGFVSEVMPAPECIHEFRKY